MTKTEEINLLEAGTFSVKDLILGPLVSAWLDDNGDFTWTVYELFGFAQLGLFPGKGLITVKVERNLLKIDHFISPFGLTIAFDDSESPRGPDLTSETAFKASCIIKVYQKAFAVWLPIFVCLARVEPIFCDQNRIVHVLNVCAWIWTFEFF